MEPSRERSRSREVRFRLTSTRRVRRDTAGAHGCLRLLEDHAGALAGRGNVRDGASLVRVRDDHGLNLEVRCGHSGDKDPVLRRSNRRPAEFGRVRRVADVTAPHRE